MCVHVHEEGIDSWGPVRERGGAGKGRGGGGGGDEESLASYSLISDFSICKMMNE